MTAWQSKGTNKADRKLALMRAAKTQAETTHNIGGVLKAAHHGKRPVTLAKLPWDKDAQKVR